MTLSLHLRKNEVVYPGRLTDPPKSSPFGFLPGGFVGGVMDTPDRLFSPATDVTLAYQHKPLDALCRAEDVPRKEGRYFYIGLVFPQHFGHFLSEDISRLWAAPQAGEIDGFVFYSFWPGTPCAPFIQDITAAFGFRDVPLIEAVEPTAFEELVIADPSRLPNGFLAASDEVRVLTDSVIKRINTNFSNVERPKKLFVSRIQFSRTDVYGEVFLENEIAENLRSEGYSVFSPELHSFEEQLHHYASAELLIFTEGSALHAYALVARKGQKVFVIQRLISSNTAVLEQISEFADVTILPSPPPTRTYRSRKTPQNGSFVLAQHDFTQLREVLLKHSFISGAPWKLPSEIREKDELLRLNERFQTM